MKKLLLSLLLLSSYCSLSQNPETSIKADSSDLSISAGLSLSENSFGRIGVIYRKALKNSLKLKIGGYYNTFHTFNTMNDVILYSSDSLIIIRNQEANNRNYTLKIGVDKSLNDFLFIGGNINIGYSKEALITVDEGLTLNDQSGKWEVCNNCVYEYQGLDVSNSTSSPGLPEYTRVEDGRDFLIYGLSLNVGVSLPISERLELAFQYSPDLKMLQTLDGTDYSYARTTHFVDAMLRFKL